MIRTLQWETKRTLKKYCKQRGLDYDTIFTDVAVGDYQHNKNKNKMNSHNLKMTLGLVATGAIGAITALYGTFPHSAAIMTVVPILVLVEHYLNGDTTTS